MTYVHLTRAQDYLVNGQVSLAYRELQMALMRAKREREPVQGYILRAMRHLMKVQPC